MAKIIDFQKAIAKKMRGTPMVDVDLYYTYLKQQVSWKKSGQCR